LQEQQTQWFRTTEFATPVFGIKAKRKPAAKVVETNGFYRFFDIIIQPMRNNFSRRLSIHPVPKAWNEKNVRQNAADKKSNQHVRASLRVFVTLLFTPQFTRLRRLFNLNLGRVIDPKLQQDSIGIDGKVSGHGRRVEQPALEHQFLEGHGVMHVYNSWDAMPPVSEQMALPGSRTNPNLTAARFLLKPGRKYDEAVKTFRPYDKVKEPYPDARAAGKALITGGKEAGATRKTFIYVNNRLEGNALGTIDAMLESNED
jgi:hypothetical protein